MGFTLPQRIAGYLNNGSAVVAYITCATPGHRVFVQITPQPNKLIPREEKRYLNSPHSMWDYWHYRFRRVELRPGWEQHPDDWDYYAVSDETAATRSENEFFELAEQWVGDASLMHNWDSDFPG